MGNLKHYEVNTPDGLNLRREPTTNFVTQDGHQNIIIAMPTGSIVTREGDEVRTSDGYTWYMVIWFKAMVIGWVASKYLKEIAGPVSLPQGSPPQGALPSTYTFNSQGTNYTITAPNLGSALDNAHKLIFTTQQTNSHKITLKSKDDNGKKYTQNFWTTSKNISTMKENKWI